MSRNNLIQNLSDYLENRQKSNNFGTCKKCSKNVYWAKTKVASHIRSGHCEGASEEEVKKFKRIYSLQQEFVYETPKHLSHRSFDGKSTRSTNDSNKSPKNGETSKQVSVNNVFIKQEPKDSEKSSVKRKKHDSEDEDEEAEDFMDEYNETNDNVKVEEFLFVANDPIQGSKPKKSVLAGSSKEEKFIAIIYPQFKGKSKMELIDEIYDLKRRIELLEIKVSTYEDTISNLL